MSKVVSFILVIVLFFGTAINSFAEGDGSSIFEGDSLLYAVVLVGGCVLLAGLFVLWIVHDFKITEAEAPDDGIRMVSTEDEASGVTTDGRTVLNFLKHLEAGVTPNKDIYVGLRFQY